VTVNCLEGYLGPSDIEMLIAIRIRPWHLGMAQWLVVGGTDCSNPLCEAEPVVQGGGETSQHEVVPGFVELEVAVPA
jgi:hypothetical protein